MAKWFRRRSRRSRVVGAVVAVAAGVGVASGLDVLKEVAVPDGATAWLTVVALAVGASAGYAIDRWVGGWVDGRFGAGRTVMDTDADRRDHFEPRGRGVMNAAQIGHRFQGRQVALSEINDWLLADDVPPLLVVTGDPGSGKSAVLGRVVTTSDPGRRGRLPRGDRGIRAPLRSVACEVHAKGATVDDVAAEIGADLGAAGRVAVSGLASLLRERLEGRGRRFVVVLDALDEAVDPRAVIREVLRPLLDAAALGVRVVVGTRRRDERGSLPAALAGQRVEIDLDMDRYFAPADLTAYSLACLRVRENGPYRDIERARALATEIARRAGRSFLVAGLVATNHGLNDSRPALPRALTGGAALGEVLDEFLDRLPPLDRVPARDLLVPLAYAQAPGLPMGLWLDLVLALTGMAVTRQALTTFAHSVGANLLVTTAGLQRVSEGDGHEPVYRLFHQALNETILDQRAEQGLADGDQHVVAVALRAAVPVTGWKDAPTYLARSLGGHLIAAGQAAEIEDLLDSSDYLLYADLPLLHAVLGGLDSTSLRDYRRLIGNTPHAAGCDTAERAAALSVTAAYTTSRRIRDDVARLGEGLDLPYRALWAHGYQDDRQIQTLTGHTSAVTAVAVTPDGRRVVTGAQSGEVWVWDLDTGAAHTVLADGVESDERPYRSGVTAVAVTPDGRRAVAIGPDVQVWDLDTGTTRAKRTGTLGGRTLAVTPDGRCAIGHNPIGVRARGLRDAITSYVTDYVQGADTYWDWSETAQLRVWDLDTGAELAVLIGHTDRVNEVVVTLDGRRAVSGSRDGTARVWDLGTAAEEAVLTNYGGSGALAVTPDGRRVLLAGFTRVRVWDLDTGVEKAVLRGHAGQVNAVVVTPDGRRVVTGSDDATVRVWDLDTGAEEAVLTGHDREVTSVAVTPDGRSIVSGSEDATVRVWNLETDAEQAVDTGHPDRVFAIAVAPEGRRVLIRSEDATVRVWDLDTGAEQAVLTGHAGRVTSVAITPDGRRAVGAELDGSRTVQLLVWDLDSRDVRTVPTGHSGWATAMAITPDGRRAVTGWFDGARTDGPGFAVRVWDLDDGTEQAMPTGRLGFVEAVAVTPDGRRAVSAATDGSVLVWGLEASAEPSVLIESGPVPWKLRVAITSDGRQAVTSFGDNTVRVWDLDTGAERAVVTGETEVVHAVVATPYGLRALTGSLDTAIVRVWDLDTGTVLRVIKVPAPVATLSVSGSIVIAVLSKRNRKVVPSPDVLALEVDFDSTPSRAR